MVLFFWGPPRPPRPPKTDRRVRMSTVSPECPPNVHRRVTREAAQATCCSRRSHASPSQQSLFPFTSFAIACCDAAFLSIVSFEGGLLTALKGFLRAWFPRAHLIRSLLLRCVRSTAASFESAPFGFSSSELSPMGCFNDASGGNAFFEIACCCPLGAFVASLRLMSFMLACLLQGRLLLG